MRKPRIAEVNSRTVAKAKENVLAVLEAVKTWEPTGRLEVGNVSAVHVGKDTPEKRAEWEETKRLLAVARNAVRIGKKADTEVAALEQVAVLKQMLEVASSYAPKKLRPMFNDTERFIQHFKIRVMEDVIHELRKKKHKDAAAFLRKRRRQMLEKLKETEG